MYMNEQENPVQETPAPSDASLDDEELKEASGGGFWRDLMIPPGN